MLSGHQLTSKFAVIADLLPTQVTLGMREVAFKRQRWRQKDRERAEHYLSNHPIPVILGLELRYFILDRHHLTRALCDEGMVQVPISIVANESALPRDEFWAVLERHYWVHPFDDKGERVAYRDIPKSISKLIDDPYRSLAGALKRAGGYSKDRSPFSEFRSGGFLRNRIDSERSRATSIGIAAGNGFGAKLRSKGASGLVGRCIVSYQNVGYDGGYGYGYPAARLGGAWVQTGTGYYGGYRPVSW